MDIVYTLDENYCEVTGVSIISLFENNKGVLFELHIIDYGITAEGKQKLLNIAEQYGQRIHFYPALDLEKKIPVALKGNGWSEICYERLFFPSILPESIVTVMHIDCDTLIRGSLEEVFNTNIDNYYYAACIDCYPKPLRSINFDSRYPYMSNGLILINLKKWREDKLEERFIDCIVDYNGNLPHLDQDVLNIVCKGNVLTLPAKYNMMTHTLMYGSMCCDLYLEEEKYYTKEEIDHAVQNPIILHFTGSLYARRPWEQPSYHWYNKEWIQYYRKADYSVTNTLLKRKKTRLSILKQIYAKFWIECIKIESLKKLRFFIDKKNVWRI